MLLALAFLAFVSLGLPDAVLGVAWPSLRTGFGLRQALLGLPLAFSAVAYFCSGLFAGRLMELLGVGRLLTLSTALVSFSVIGYALAPSFPLFLVGAPLVGFGSGAIDAALNTYAARNFSAQYMSWLHAAYAAGAMAGPVIMTAALANGASYRAGYALVGVLLALLVPAFFVSRRRWTSDHLALPGPGRAEVTRINPVAEVDSPSPHGAGRSGALAALRSRPVQLHIILFFLYAGLEVSAGQWCYTVLTEARAVPSTEAGVWTAAYWGGLLAGRLLLGLAVKPLGQLRLLRFATLGAVLAASLFALPNALLAAVALPVLSFALASIYPGLMSETPRRVGEALAPHAVGFQVSAATVGMAAVPGITGVLSEHLGLAAVHWVLIACALGVFVVHERVVAGI
jgi:fucose permease